MKKILSLALSLILLLSLAVPVAAASDVQCPTIYVPGFLTSALYTDTSDVSTKVSLPSSDELLELVKKDLVPAVFDYTIDKDGDKLGHAVSKIANQAFSGYFYNSDGSAKDNAGAIMTYPSAASIRKNSNLYFHYDWRGDPVAIAEDLKNFIDYVTANSGSDKVALRCHSLGSVIATSYLTLYGNEKVMGVVFDAPALEGITYIGELLCGRVEIAGDALLQAMKDLLGENEYNELINSTLDILEIAGLHNGAGDFLDGLVQEIAPVLYEETLIPLFGYWPSVWAMTPDSYYQKATEYVFSNYFDGDEYAPLKEKISNYNNQVRPYKKTTLLEFDKIGRMVVLSRYGFATLPVTNEWNVLSDTVVDTKNSSLGATTTVYGQSFSEEYLEGKDMSLISPDRTVDASTCLFPEKTWFIKNLKHDRTDVTKDLHLTLLFSEEESTVENSGLPQFMIFDAETDTLSEDKGEYKAPVEENETASFLAKIMKFFTAIFNFFTNLFKK